jgi:hypothetical protein
MLQRKFPEELIQVSLKALPSGFGSQSVWLSGEQRMPHCLEPAPQSEILKKSLKILLAS